MTKNVTIANILQLEAAWHRASRFGLFLAKFMRTNCYFPASGQKYDPIS